MGHWESPATRDKKNEEFIAVVSYYSPHTPSVNNKQQQVHITLDKNFSTTSLVHVLLVPLSALAKFSIMVLISYSIMRETNRMEWFS